jgi:peptidoglycan/xylan/chitin deacetylase (PgdA/CDA1 family)
MNQPSLQRNLKVIKRVPLRVLKSCGVFEAMRDSAWRRKRLLILCYHGTALEDEHLWRAPLFMPIEQFAQRLECIKRGGYRVLPLKEALQRLRTGHLPEGSIAITFDDGTYDFYKQAFPLIKKYGFPVTVYQTTYYSDRQIPVFNIICSYMLWKRRGQMLDLGRELGLETPLDLRNAVSRQEIVLQLLALTQNLTGEAKNEVASRLAELLGIDFGEIMSKRILQIMSPSEIEQLARDGVDFQLHTHRHRTPKDRLLFQTEIRQNRERLRELTGQTAEHFCYPAGVYDRQFLPWLEEEGVKSATTCDISLATASHNPLLLPRFIDTPSQSEIEYESWLSGVGHVLSRRRPSRQKFVPVGD